MTVGPPQVLQDLVERTGFDPLDWTEDRPQIDDGERGAALDHLRARFVDGAVVEDGAWWDAVATRLLEDEAPARFVDEVLLAVPSAGHYMAMTDVIAWLLPPDALVDVVMDLLHHDDERAALALGLVELHFGRIGGPRLGEANRRRLVEAVERRRHHGSRHASTTSALERFTIPHDPIVH